MERVIFACVHNAGRSQVAAALFSEMADPTQVEVVSAGTQPSDRVHPEVIDVMREVGIDVSRNLPQRLTEEFARGASLMVTMGCGDECPHVPGLQRDDWRCVIPRISPWPRFARFATSIRDRIALLIESRGWRRPLSKNMTAAFARTLPIFTRFSMLVRRRNCLWRNGMRDNWRCRVSSRSRGQMIDLLGDYVIQITRPRV